MLLSEFVGHTKSIDMDFLVRSWEAHVSVEDQSRRGVGEGRGRGMVRESVRREG